MFTPIRRAVAMIIISDRGSLSWNGTSSAVARLSAAALFVSSNNHDRPIAEILLDPRPATTLGQTPFRLVRLNVLPGFSSTAVQEDLDLFIPGEIPRQVLRETRFIPRHDDEVTRQSGPCPEDVREPFDSSKSPPSGNVPARTTSPEPPETENPEGPLP